MQSRILAIWLGLALTTLSLSWAQGIHSAPLCAPSHENESDISVCWSSKGWCSFIFLLQRIPSKAGQGHNSNNITNFNPHPSFLLLKFTPHICLISFSSSPHLLLTLVISFSSLLNHLLILILILSSSYSRHPTSSLPHFFLISNIAV